MGVQMSDAELDDLPIASEALEFPLSAYDGRDMANDDRLSAARGIMIAALLSLPFWALIAFAVYLVL